MAASKSLYDVLGVAPEAEPVVIDAAYKALIKKYHPDQAADVSIGGRDAAEINEAFAILKDPERRSEYDRRFWTKQQAIRLAELNAIDRQPRRGSRLFGWSGWLVAVAIGIAFAATSASRNIAAPVPASVLQAAAKAEERRVSPEELAARKAAAALDEGPDHPSGDAVIARVRASIAPPVVRPAPLRNAAPLPVRQATPAARPTRKPAPTPRQRAEKADFLEREGYIY